MNGAVVVSDDERWLEPRLRTHPVRKVVRAHHAEEAEEGTFAFAKDNGATANDGELGSSSRVADALFLFGRSHGKDACEKTSRRQSLRGDFTIVGDVTAHFEPARDLLRVIAFDAAARGKVRRTTEDEIELFIGFESVCVPEVTVANIETILKAVPLDGFAGEADAFILRFHGDEASGLQTPRSDESDGADATAEIEDAAGGGGPRRAVPGSEDVVGGKTVALLELENTEVTADGIQRLSGFKWWPFAACAGRHRAGFGPPAKIRIQPVHDGTVSRTI